MQYAKPVTLNVEECDRLSFLPYLFGNDFLYAEAYVYALAQKMMPEYQGGFWHFIRLPDGGGYMMPDGDRFHMVNGANWFDRTVSADAAGIILTSLVINRPVVAVPRQRGCRTDPALPDARCAVVASHRISPRMQRDLRGTGLINGRGGNAAPVKETRTCTVLLKKLSAKC
ncbi:Antirestriction protein [Citrobacter koseri]|nr:Antirestriction protein [Citrobacter koseri]